MEDSELLELIELPNGDIALRKAEGSDEPIVSISFSKDSLENMQNIKMDIARAMVEAAILRYQAALEIADEQAETPQTLH